MDPDFYFTARFQMALPGQATGVDGSLILAAALPSHTLLRRRLDAKHSHLARRLLDPQLYLTELNPVTCRKACANLASYGWFSVKDIESYKSSQQKQSDWKRDAEAQIHRRWSGVVPNSPSGIEGAIRLCISTQEALRCESLILPVPLTVDLDSDFSQELEWIDRGLDLASSMSEKPRYLTVAISDTCLRSKEPWSNQLLEVIVDQITAREPEGVYIVLELANEAGYYISHPHTIGALLRLIYGLKQGGISYVMAAFSGMAGLLAVAAGADAWSTGWYRGERRLKLVDFESDMGLAVPTFYSHALASEIHLESDLDRIVRAGFVDQIEDITDASAGLMQALRHGRKAESVPEWRYSKSNVTAAREHLLEAAVRETARLSGLSASERLHYAHFWLSRADQLATDLYRIGSFNPRTELNHQAAWLQAFERFTQHIQ